MLKTIPEMRRIKNIHFVGVGGVGMGGIAEVLLNQGYRISGSDLKHSAMTQRLVKAGVDVKSAIVAKTLQALMSWLFLVQFCRVIPK